MGENELRQIARDSLFVMADLRVDGLEGEHRIRVRNLSAGGLMAEASVTVQRGQLVWTNVRKVGWVEGSVAWVQDNRFGIAFRDEIDPRMVRVPSQPSKGSDYLVRRPLLGGGTGTRAGGGAIRNLRKI